MASGGTAPNRKTSVSSLIQSSIVSGLSIVPESEKQLDTLEESAHPIKTDRRQRVSQTRLNFLSKSSAGSASSGQQARLPKQASVESTSSVGSLVSPGMDQHRALGLQTQASSSSLTSGDVHREEDFPIPKSATISGLIPRHPTGDDWTRSRASDKLDSIALQEVLGDLDQKARDTGTGTRTRVLSQETAALVNQPVSWEENATSNNHLWHEQDTREACYLNETQYCQQLKVFHPRRTKLKCSACKVVAHTTCIKQLYYEGICCKYTFREIKQKVKDSVKTHHFLKRRKASGKCSSCDKGFGSWKKFSGREFIGVSCSWCGDSYHMSCFNEGLRREPCHMGPLRNLIVPPSWIVRTPLVEPQQYAEAASPKASRRKTRRSRRRKNDDRASKNFIVKPFVAHHKPLLVFINPKSGGNQGAKLLQTFQWLLNPRQVFDLSQGSPKFGLQFFQNVSNFRVLACGGDGTAGWVLATLDTLDIRPAVPIAILPLGTGNDLARVLKWGGGYTDEPIDKILMHVDEGPVVDLDRWHLGVWPNPNLPADQAVDCDAVGDVPLHVINNYFSIGADAQVALEFHLEREANPERYNSRFKNKFFYGRAGGKDVFVRRFHSMTDDIQLWGDGENLTAKIRNLRLESICFLNIPSHGGGTNPWGTPPTRDQRVGPQMMNDGRIEIVGFWAATLAKLQVGLAHGERIAQCEHIKMITDRALPVQIDGEACKLLPSVIEVVLKNKVPMVTKVARRLAIDTPLHGVEERVKLSVSKVTLEQYDRLHSDVSELKRIAKSVGIIHGSAKDSLKTVRAQINLFTNDLNEDGEEQLKKTWRFLDVAASGRFDRMFQVLPDQEETIFIGDMFSDGLFVVEMETSSPVATPEATPQILLSPHSAESSPPFASAENKRKAFGRNASYELATNETSISPPSLSPVKEVTRVALEVPLGNGLQSTSSEGTPVAFDDEPAILPQVVDTDSGETDANAHGPSSVQRALLDAVKRGHMDKVIEYHKKGAKLTAADSNGWTPLHHAARLEKKQVVQYIVDNVTKASLDIAEEEKVQTALHKAAWFGYRDICKILVEAGASLDRRDYQGNTPHDKAVQSGDAELRQYLKKKEAELKWKTSEQDEVAI